MQTRVEDGEAIEGILGRARFELFAEDFGDDERPVSCNSRRPTQNAGPACSLLNDHRDGAEGRAVADPCCCEEDQEEHHEGEEVVFAVSPRHRPVWMK